LKRRIQKFSVLSKDVLPPPSLLLLLQKRENMKSDPE
jgi:hypothetical protein